MILWFVSLSPTWGSHSVSAEPALDPLSPSLPAPPLLECALSLSLSLSKIIKH